MGSLNVFFFRQQASSQSVTIFIQKLSDFIKYLITQSMTNNHTIRRSKDKREKQKQNSNKPTSSSTKIKAKDTHTLLLPRFLFLFLVSKLLLTGLSLSKISVICSRVCPAVSTNHIQMTKTSKQFHPMKTM